MHLSRALGAHDSRAAVPVVIHQRDVVAETHAGRPFDGLRHAVDHHAGPATSVREIGATREHEFGGGIRIDISDRGIPALSAEESRPGRDVENAASVVAAVRDFRAAVRLQVADRHPSDFGLGDGKSPLQRKGNAIVNPDLTVERDHDLQGRVCVRLAHREGSNRSVEDRALVDESGLPAADAHDGPPGRCGRHYLVQTIAVDVAREEGHPPRGGEAALLPLQREAGR